MNSISLETTALSVILSLLLLSPFYLRRLKSDLASQNDFESTSTNLTSRFNAYKILFATLLLALLDYLIKVYIFLKNLLYFPLGVDHRIFKRSITKLGFDGAKITVTNTPNDFYLGLRQFYTLICLATYAISIWLFHSIANTFAPFIDDKNKLLLYSLITSCAVFLCDVSIIRTMISSRATNSDSDFIKFCLFGYRSLIVAATSLLLAFSLSIPLLENSLSRKLRDETKQEIISSKEISDLAAERDSLVSRIHRLNAKRYCAGFALTGSKGTSAIYPAERWREASNELPPVPVVRPNVIREATFTPPALNCNEFLDIKESPCPSKQLSSACPNSFRLSREIYIEAAGLLGTQVADQRYALANATTLFRTYPVETQKSELGVFQERIDRVNKKFAVAEALEVYVPIDCNGTTTNGHSPSIVQNSKEGSLITSTLIDATRSLFIPKIFRCGTPTESRRNLDINQVAGVVFDHYGNIFGSSKGMILVFAVALIIALFELLVVVLKSTGTLGHLELLLGNYNAGYIDFVKNNLASSRIESEASFGSDFTMTEHLGRIGEAFRIVVATHMNSTLRCWVVNAPLFISLWWILYHVVDSFLLPFVRLAVTVF